jgi:3-oxoacid CoA-transferase subunit B
MTVALARLTRTQLAARVAAELHDGWYVNVGIGMPTLVPNVLHLEPEREVVIHSENGILGVGRRAEGQELDPDLVNAGREMVTVRPGASFFHHADSFAMVRGGHLDCAILGAYQVSEQGDLANWLLKGARLGNPGGAMDLAVGARRVFAMMEHVTRDGAPKIVRRCDYALTGVRCVTTIFTDIAVIDVGPDGLILRELAPSWSVEDVQALTEPTLRLAGEPGTIRVVSE